MWGPAQPLSPAPEPRFIPSEPIQAVRSEFDTLGLIAYAASMQGKPYRVAGDTPADGFDCSGLVYHVFHQFDLELPRNAAAMAGTLPEVSLNKIVATDLLFFNTQHAPFSHVGIYLGDGRFVHAPSPQTGRVIISKVANRYWKTRLTAARRPALVSVALGAVAP
ncbi:MAG: NlpC/P60 family protein [Gammaproteobacteria bacterium]|nr:NlpC/P60 family protein [Gammaproteobacteria bacterium]